MILFVELCVDLKKGKLAKDGLYQYKNTAQNTNVGTIEVGLHGPGYSPSFSTFFADRVLIIPSLFSKSSSNLQNRKSPKPKRRRTRFNLLSSQAPRVQTSKTLKPSRHQSQYCSLRYQASNLKIEPIGPSSPHG